MKILVLLSLLLPAAALAQRDDSRTLTWQGFERTYVVHFPAGDLSTPAPLVVALAGLTQHLDSLREWFPIDPVADQNRFIVAYPQAIDFKWNYWHGSGQLLPGGTEEIDDVGFISAVVDNLVREHLADPARVFVTGLSRGALMSGSLACERAEMFNAAAPNFFGHDRLADGALSSGAPDDDHRR
jgi:polyhydroxybutyrate depolymerase